MRELAPAIVLAGVVLFASPALAQEANEEDAAESRSATFEAAEGAQAEEVPGGTLLIAAYGVAWFLIFAFVASIAFRQARTARDLERLQHDLSRRRDGA